MAILNNSFPKNQIEIAAIYNNIATCYSKKTKNIDFNYINMDDVRKSIFYYNKSLIIYLNLFGEKNKVVADLYNNIGIIKNRVRHLKSAKKYLLKSVKIYIALFGKNDLSVATSISNLCLLYKNTGEYSEAIRLYNKSIKIVSRFKGLENFTARRLYFLATVYSELGNFNKALKYNESGIKTYLKFKKTSLEKYILKETDLFLLESLFLKINLQWSKYKLNKKYRYIIINLYKIIHKVVKYLEVIRINYTYEGSKNILNVKSVSFFEKAIEVCLEMYKIHNEEKYLEEAYMYSQKSKSLSLLENIKEFNAKISSNIPSGLLKLEINLKKKISECEKQIYEETKKTDKSEIKINELRNKLFNLKQKIESLVKKLEKEFPEYYNMKNEFKTYTSGDIKNQISDDTMIIEYFLGDENIFAFVFTKNESYVKQMKKFKSFDKKITEYRNLLKQVSNILDNNSILKFKKLSFYIYKILIKNILDSKINMFIENKGSKNQIKNILIIPDNELNFIPFDSLITSDNNIDKNFSDLPYLIKHFNIVFSYSVVLYLSQLNEVRKKPNAKILAFAPSFASQNKKRIADQSNNFRDSLAPLNYNLKEVKEIKDQFNGLYFFGKDAVKEKLINNKKHYSVLHLATHSIVDDENPMYSKIVFSKTGKQSDEGFLHTYEIYELNSNYDLVVLSACNTGFGRMIRGEGVMSIARAFASSGSKNIIMSLWQVNDKSTSDIMKIFYRNLANGEKVGEALRNAKLNYLEKSDLIKSLPFYWSPFISFGVNNSIK